MDSTERTSYREVLELVEKWQYGEIEKTVSKLLAQRLAEIEEGVKQSYKAVCILQLADAIGQNKILEEQGVNLKAALKDMKSQLDICKREKEELKSGKAKQEERLKSEMAEQEKQLRGEMAKQKQRLKDEMAVQKDRLKSELEERSKQIKRLQKKVDGEEQRQKGYRWACDNNISSLLPFIETGSYEAFIMSVFNRENIARIYDHMKQDHENGELCYIEIYKYLIKEYMKISCQVRGEEYVRWQSVEIGELYESACFDKVAGAKETGEITKILYRGLEENGRLMDGCKSLVEVG